MEDKERLTIVLRHLIEHNEGHGEEYKRWTDLARNGGLGNAAQLIEEANRHVEQASDALKRALELIAQ